MEAILTLDKDLIQKYAESKLLSVAEKMPNGHLWNTHNSGSPDRCDGLGLTLDGQVVAIYKAYCCTLNKVRVLEPEQYQEFEGETFKTALSSWAYGGNLYWKGTWEESIKAYNATVCPERLALIAYVAFE